MSDNQLSKYEDVLLQLYGESDQNLGTCQNKQGTAFIDVLKASNRPRKTSERQAIG
jgi:hypothetical protein